MSEMENLRDIIETMEMDFKEIKKRIGIIEGKMVIMRETIKHLEESESPKRYRVEFGKPK